MRRKITILTLIILAAIFSQTYAQPADKHFDYLKNTYDKHDKKLSDFLLTEFDVYQEIYPDSPHSTEACYLMGQIFIERKNMHEALATLMKMLFLYPNERFGSFAATDINRIVNNSSSYAEKAEFIKKTIDGIAKDGTRADRLYAYLEFLYDLNQSRLYDFAIKENYRFIAEYPEDSRTERVQRFIAGLLTADGKDEAAVAAYIKYEILYPESEHIPQVKNHRARLLYDELKDYQNALTVLDEVIEKYPDSRHEAEAYYLKAEIKSQKLRDYEGAVADYRTVVNRRPDHKKAPDALLAMAEISEKKLKKYNASIAFYDQLAADYSKDRRCISALEEAARIHTKLREFDMAAAKLARIATLFPDYEKSPRHLMNAGKICTDKLKEYKRAIGYYQLVKEQYPDSEYSRSAEKKLLSLKEKVEW